HPLLARGRAGKVVLPVGFLRLAVESDSADPAGTLVQIGNRIGLLVADRDRALGDVPFALVLHGFSFPLRSEDKHNHCAYQGIEKQSMCDRLTRPLAAL